MRFLTPSSTTGLLLALSFFTTSNGATLEKRAGREVVCASSEQKCLQPGSPSYCCPKAGMKCGEIKGQCIKISTGKATSTPKKTPSTIPPASAATSSVSPSSQTTPAATSSSPPKPSSTTAKSTKKPGALEKMKNFFKPNIIIIFAASGGSALLLLAIITCFCYRKRKQGRLLLAAYENPNRDAYKSVILSNGKPSVASADTAKNVEGDPVPPPSANPAPRTQSERSPQPQYFDLYSPESPAFQMTEQKPAGPLENYNGRGGDGALAGYCLPLEPQQQPYYQQQEEKYYSEDERQQLYYPEAHHQDPNYHGYGGGAGDIYGTSPGDYAAGHIYTDYATPRQPENVYTGHVREYPEHMQEYPPRQYTPPEFTPQAWSPQHYRQITPPQHAYTAQQSPPRPPRGPDVYLPAALAGHRGMPHAV